MHLLIISMVSLLIAQSAVFYFGSSAGQNNSAMSVRAEIQAQQFRLFRFAAGEFVKKNPVSSTSVSTFTWNQIRNHSTTPSYIKQFSIPDGWSIKVNNSEWHLCATIDGSSKLLLSTPSWALKEGLPMIDANQIVVYTPHSWCSS